MAKGFRAAAADWVGMVVYRGFETRRFLQGQLTIETERFPVGSWTWGGYLTDKGRMLATYVALSLENHEIGLVMDKGLIDGTLKRLKRYQLRAKTEPEIDGRAWTATVGEDLGQGGSRFLRNVDGAEITVPLGGGAALRIATTDRAAKDPAVEDGFRVACARQGMPWLTAPLQDRLTAHMVSLDLAGGIDFNKGCYLGQEIVVRSHHRGAIKKRAFVVTGKGAAPEQGTELLSGVHGGQAAGQFVYGGAEGDGFCGLAALRKDAAGGELELEDGREVSASPPPYGLIDEKFEKA